jgi:hypothetical protein
MPEEPAGKKPIDGYFGLWTDVAKNRPDSRISRAEPAAQTCFQTDNFADNSRCYP